MNISHLRCGPVGVRFMRLRRIYRTRNDGRHKCRPYKYLKGKFLSDEVRDFAPAGRLECWNLGLGEINRVRFVFFDS